MTIQVLPFSRGAHASMFGPYVVLGFPEEGALDVALADNPTGSTWREREAEVARNRDLRCSTHIRALSGGIPCPNPVQGQGVQSMTSTRHSTPDLSGARWRSSTYSSGNNECVEVADDMPGIIPVRDS
jgi:hypothetical protein